MKTTSAIYFLLILIFFLNGCRNNGDYETPKSTYQTMVKATKSDNLNAMLDCFSNESREDYKKLLALASENEGDKQGEKFIDIFIEEIQFDESKIEDDKASFEAIVDGQKHTVEFVKEDGNWKMHMPDLKDGIRFLEEMVDNISISMSSGSTSVYFENMLCNTLATYAILNNEVIYIIWPDIQGSSTQSISYGLFFIKPEQWSGQQRSENGVQIEWQCKRTDDDRWTMTLIDNNYDLRYGNIFLISTKEEVFRVRVLQR